MPFLHFSRHSYCSVIIINIIIIIINCDIRLWNTDHVSNRTKSPMGFWEKGSQKKYMDQQKIMMEHGG
jgi:hypothetical protein